MAELKLRISDIKTLFAEVKKLNGTDFSNYAYFTIKRRVEKVFKKYNFLGVKEFITKINNDSNFLENFIFNMHPHQTELFRDPDLWNNLIKNVFPKISKKETINVYVPFCTSGDELYSLIFLLDDANLIKKTKIFISPASKKNKAFIEKGIYPIKKKESADKNFERLLTNKTIDDFILYSNHSYEIKEKFKTNLIFDETSFLNANYIAEFDLVLFRNSLIYFNAQMHEEAINKITSAMKKNGYLIIGVGEKIIGENEKKYKQLTKTENIFKKNS